MAGIINNNGTSIASLTKTGPGTLILTNALNAGSMTNTGFTGGLILNQGIVTAATATDLGVGGTPITFTGSSVLQLSAQNGGFTHNFVTTNSSVIATL